MGIQVYATFIIVVVGLASLPKISKSENICASNNFKCLNCLSTHTPKSINGTTLKTATFYLVRMTTDVLTYSRNANRDGQRFVIADSRPATRHQYKNGGTLYPRNQWYFLPAEGYPGYYHFVNVALPSYFAGWKVNFFNEKYIAYFVLNPNYSVDSPLPEYLFKVMQDGNSFQLQTHGLPFGIICKFAQNPWDKHYILIDSIYDTDFSHGGEFYNSTLFQFEMVNDAETIRYHASITKIGFLENFDNFSVNDESVAISGDFPLLVNVTEGVYVEQPNTFPKFDKISVQDCLVIENTTGPPVLQSPKFHQQLLTFLTKNDNPGMNFTVNKELLIRKPLETPGFTECQYTATLQTVKDLVFEYEISFWIIGQLDGELVKATELQAALMQLKNKESGNDVEYIGILDEFTVIAKTRGKMWVSYGLANTISSKV